MSYSLARSPLRLPGSADILGFVSSVGDLSLPESISLALPFSNTVHLLKTNSAMGKGTLPSLAIRLPRSENGIAIASFSYHPMCGMLHILSMC